MDVMEWTVNEALHAAPELVGTLNRLGLDTCCGGTLTLAEAGRAAGLTPEDLVVALGPALRGKHP